MFEKTDFRKVKSFFLEAMKHGFVAAEPKGEAALPLVPGFKSYTYVKDNLKLVDTYFDGNHTGGMTIIWEDGVPVWIMTFSGYYHLDEVPTLITALRTEYEKSRFNGGRGPNLFIDGARVYTNIVEESNFESARGHERITDENGKILGWHYYACGKLVR